MTKRGSRRRLLHEQYWIREGGRWRLGVGDIKGLAT